MYILALMVHRKSVQFPSLKRLAITCRSWIAGRNTTGEYLFHKHLPSHCPVSHINFIGFYIGDEAKIKWLGKMGREEILLFLERLFSFLFTFCHLKLSRVERRACNTYLWHKYNSCPFARSQAHFLLP